ncbi:MAG: 50S ribosomal protein L28 [Planctomycetota bacterium]|jgi:large subunit ribosomal protein L28
MARVCAICGKGTHAGRSIARRGRPKYLGGVGLKTTGVTKRTFRPNLQRVRALVDGSAKRIRVCAKCIRNGKVTKAVR